MKQIMITGMGLLTPGLEHLENLHSRNIDQYPKIPVAKATADYSGSSMDFQNKAVIAREDRSLLNNMTKLGIDASMQALKKAEETRKFSAEDKENFVIFTAAEMMEYDLSALDNLLEDNNQDITQSLNALAGIKKYLKPLDMLRLLSTNLLYHLSKLMEFRGGGYPVKRMSLSGFAALQLAAIAINKNRHKALICAVGNMCIAENLCAFIKMGLIKTHSDDNGIVPAFAAAALIIEKADKAIEEGPSIAAILAIESIYMHDTIVKKADWLMLFAKFSSQIEIDNLYLILYANGVNQLMIEEMTAVAEFFPGRPHFSYKQFLGYTGKANNLIDLILALTDRRIPLGSQILINGVGTAVGLGAILLRKLNHG